jgi:hypothetical protein
VSYFEALDPAAAVLAPLLPDEIQHMLGYTVRWHEDVPDDKGKLAPSVEGVEVLITGVRWARDPDNRIEHGWIQFLMDRMDGTMKWTEPLRIVLERPEL